jgi:hypothetical protein
MRRSSRGGRALTQQRAPPFVLSAPASVAATSTCWWRLLLRVLCGPRAARRASPERGRSDAHTLARLAARPVTQAAAHVSGALAHTPAARCFVSAVACRLSQQARAPRHQHALTLVAPRCCCRSAASPRRTWRPPRMSAAAWRRRASARTLLARCRSCASMRHLRPCRYARMQQALGHAGPAGAAPLARTR